MATTRRAYTGGAQSTTTTSAIASSGTTSFTITAYTGWPYGSDPFFVVVEPGTASEEKILVTRTGSTDTTINIASDSERAQDGTSAVGHSSGSVVFPVFTALDADEANELTSSWSTKGDLVSYGSSTFETLGVGTNDQVLIADSGETSGLKWGSVDTAQLADDAVTGAKLAQGYTYHSTVIFTSSGTFTKATYPWLRAIRAICVAGGGGGGNRTGNVSAGGGGGGGTSFTFITDIASLGSSVTVTVGAGGSGASTGTSPGSDGTGGGSSTFNGVGAAGGGSTTVNGLNGGSGGGSVPTIDYRFRGVPGGVGGGDVAGQNGGSTWAGGGGRGSRGGGSPENGLDYGGGGGGGYSDSGGADGADGIVILELYA